MCGADFWNSANEHNWYFISSEYQLLSFYFSTPGNSFDVVLYLLLPTIVLILY